MKLIENREVQLTVSQTKLITEARIARLEIAKLKKATDLVKPLLINLSQNFSSTFISSSGLPVAEITVTQALLLDKEGLKEKMPEEYERHYSTLGQKLSVRYPDIYLELTSFNPTNFSELYGDAISEFTAYSGFSYRMNTAKFHRKAK